MYLMNTNQMGGYTPGGPDNVVAKVPIGGCWCGESYFTGSDGIGRIVSSGGAKVGVWKVLTKPLQLSLESSSTTLVSGQDAGFFTSVSSNGTDANSAIIWAVGRPQNSGGAVMLYALNAANSSILYSQSVGTWPSPASSDADIVPVVANGMVYLAVGSNLYIFGPDGSASVQPAAQANEFSQYAGNQVFGTVVGVSDTTVSLKTRSGSVATVDTAPAVKKHNSVTPVLGHALMVDGSYLSDGTLRAEHVLPIKDMPALWPADK
jgi:hypothetical protein